MYQQNLAEVIHQKAHQFLLNEVNQVVKKLLHLKTQDQKAVVLSLNQVLEIVALKVLLQEVVRLELAQQEAVLQVDQKVAIAAKVHDVDNTEC